MPARLGLVAVALAAATWAIGAVGAGVAFERGIGPLELGASRVWITALGFAVVVAGTRSRATPEERPGLATLLAFGVAIALVSVVFFFAIERLGVAIGTVLHYMGPLFVVLYGIASDRRRPPLAVLVAALVAFAGVALVSNALGRQLSSVDAGGILIGLASGALFASYTILAERTIPYYGPLRALLRGFAIGGLIWALLLAPRGWPHAVFAPENLAIVLFVGLVGTCLPFLLFVWGIQRVRAERAAIAATLEPVISGVIGWIVLAQALSPVQILGGVLILGAVLSLQVNPPAAVVIERPASTGSSTVRSPRRTRR